MKVALQSAPLGILGRDQPLPGGLQLVEALYQLGGEPGVLQYQAGFSRKVREQAPLRRRHWLSLRNGKRAQ